MSCMYTLRTCRQNVQGIPWSVVHRYTDIGGTDTGGVQVHSVSAFKTVLYVCGTCTCVHV
jgi:hypothetical protein